MYLQKLPHKMKIIILHHDLEPEEIKIKEILEQKGFLAELKDIRDVDIEEIEGNSVVLNRVYASVANRDFSSIEKTLDLLKKLEAKGIPCINSYFTSLYDYNKFEAYKKLKENGILTPETILVDSEQEIENLSEKAIEAFGLPLIIKRNTGGRAKDVWKANSVEELKKDLINKFENAKKENYAGGFIIQEFAKTTKGHDCRLTIFDSKPISSLGRTLVSLDSTTPWLASASKGSQLIEFEASQEVIDLAIKASQVIGAKFNSLDIMFTEKGPSIIENNPTPNYSNISSLEGVERLKGFVSQIVLELNKFPVEK